MTKNPKQEKNEPTTLEDSILVGIMLAMALDEKNEEPAINVTPHKNWVTNRVNYSISGDVERILQRIYNNEKIGSLTALNSVKACRSMLFSCKSGGQK